MRFLRLAALVLALLPLARPVMAQVDARVAALPALAADDPVRALAQIETLLAEVQARQDSDPALLLDLNRMAAQLLSAQGRHAEAARLLDNLARFVDRQPDPLVDPVTIWRAAAAAHEAAGNPRGAIGAEEAALARLRASAAPPQVLAATLERLAVLAGRAGDTAAAQGYRDAARSALFPEVEKANRSWPGQGGYAVVPVHYATDRARSDSDDPEDFYGYARGPLDYGIAEVSIPDQHIPGAIERPSIWKLEFAPDPARHVMLRSVTPMAGEAFFASLASATASRPRPEIVLFIHGYNVSFGAAARRAAQLAHDMNYPGLPVLYSWPSQGSTVGYLSDAAVVQLSGRHLSRFLDDLVARSGAQTIHIVAHSMGNRALTEALELYALRNGIRPGDPPDFGQVIFAAPDVDAGLFAEILPTMRPVAQRMTLYASENDWALVASRNLHGNMARAGQAGADTLAVGGLDTVDMSALGADMLAHGYFADDRSALADLVAVLWRNAAPERRCGLVPHQTADAWMYQPADCPDADLLPVLSTLQADGIDAPDAAIRRLDRLITDPTRLVQIRRIILRILSP
ncbi:alpha/beta hydrolase [Gemmobacter sp.]|uniref:alpha/beta hydrolase n=1 Tax=Gemmobacter sp. TaxID=1898957 RepID=UPI002AFFA999|nr:alpha/beta hydrolase [Gemmobacter sp.]